MRKVVAIDTGIGWEHARAFTKDGWRVIIHRPTLSSSFPILKYVIPGFGFDGIRIGDLWTELLKDDVDLVLILDLPTGGLGDYLRQYLHIPCLGGGIAERLELDRVWAKRVLRKYGIPTPKAYVVRGIENLKRLLKELDGNGVIKIDTFRGDFETKVTSSYEEAEQMIAGIYQTFGPYANVVRFIVEEKIPDSVLIGGDWVFDGEKFWTPYHFSLEIRPHCIGKWVESSIPILDEVKERMERLLKDLEYRGFYSNELLYQPTTGKGYLIDQNVRPPYPLSLSFPVVIKNYTDLLYKASTTGFGENKVQVDYPFVGIVAIYASADEKNWIPVKIKDNFTSIRWRSATMIDGIPYIVPTDNIAGVVVGVGNSVEELLHDLEKQFEQVTFQKKEEFDISPFNKVVKFLKDTGLD